MFYPGNCITFKAFCISKENKLCLITFLAVIRTQFYLMFRMRNTYNTYNFYNTNCNYIVIVHFALEMIRSNFVLE